MNQKFSGPVESVAGRDSIKVVLGDQRKPESQLQSEFAQRTGIWCPREARELLECLLHRHGFIAKELAHAWRHQLIRWNAKEGCMEAATPLIEAMFGWGVAITMAVYFLLLAIPAALSQSGFDALLTFALGALMYLGGCWMSFHFILWPRRVALRVQRVLSAEDVPGSAERAI